MPYYYYILLAISVLTCVYAIRFFKQRNRVTPFQLFNKALRDENSGYFNEAFINYANALSEVDRLGFHRTLKSRIHEKLKVLRTIIEYEKGIHMTSRINAEVSKK